MYVLTKHQFLVLTTLLNYPMHPYMLRQQLIELSGRTVWPSHSSLRHALDHLEKSGYIQECEPPSDSNYWLKARRSVPYELTEAGYKRVRRELSMYYEIFVKSRPWLEKMEKFDT